MENKDEIMDSEKCELLNIFKKEEDEKGTDLLAMSDFFEVFIEKISVDMKNNAAWEIVNIDESQIGEIIAAIKAGRDIYTFQTGMLVADYSHFNKDIIDGLKKGVYHIGRSKEIAGNLRPVILDKNERLVKFFTLKKAVNLSNILSDISVLSMQISLQRISSQLEGIGRDIQSGIEFVRREALSNKFLYARDRIMSAATAFGDEQETYLKKADEYLMEGLTDLYADVNAQVEKLNEVSKGVLAKIEEIDSRLSYIYEDMQMIPRYVGLRVYLLNYRGKADNAKRILSEYRYQLQNWVKTKAVDDKYTALELIHQYYPYNEENVDFWLEKPKQMIEAIDSYKSILESKNKNVFYIDVEDTENE